MGFFGIFNKNKTSTGIFIPDENGFKEYTGPRGNGSINQISENIGYHPDQVNTYFGNFDQSAGILNVILEIFTKNIAFVLTEDSVTNLKATTVNRFMKDFDFDNEFDNYKTRTILERGIANKSLKIAYLSKVLNMQNTGPDGLYYAAPLGLYLYFIGGYLVNIQSSDGLSDWAKRFRQIHHLVFKKYEEVAKLYWDDNVPRIINELNYHFDAWGSIPDALNNEYTSLHETSNGTINMAMLLVCHYNKPITIQEFLTINHGRFVQIEVNRYRAGKFIYDFSDDGELASCYQSG